MSIQFTMNRFQKFLKGLQILSEYDTDLELHAEHDILYCGNINLPESVSDGHRQELDDLGFHIDSNFNSWAWFT